MVKPKIKPQETKSYQPSTRMKSFLEEGAELLEKGNSHRSWQRKKVSLLDNIFQSLADLIYFLETLATNPELREVFEKDLVDLLDPRTGGKVGGLPYSIALDQTGIQLMGTNLVRLIYASLIPRQSDYKNFRLTLMTQIQVIIFEKLWYIMQEEYGMTNQITKSVFSDMRKAVGWVAMLSKPKEFLKDNPNRIINFKAPYRIK